MKKTKIDYPYMRKNWVELISYSIVVVFCIYFIISLFISASIFIELFSGIVDIVSTDFNETSVISDFQLMQQMKANFFMPGAIWVISLYFFFVLMIGWLMIGTANEIARIVIGERTDTEKLDAIVKSLRIKKADI